MTPSAEPVLFFGTTPAPSRALKLDGLLEKEKKEENCIMSKVRQVLEPTLNWGSAVGFIFTLVTSVSNESTNFIKA